MLIQIFLQILISIINIIFSWLPLSNTLPLGLDSIFVTASSYFHGAMRTLPYLNIVWTCFLYALSFELLMIVLKLFLGHRSLGHNAN